MRYLFLNQCFHPDRVSSGQHLTDLALRLQAGGHEVTVLTGSRGYDNPSLRFPSRERWRGIEIRRIPTLGLGKGARWRRALDFASFLLFCALRLAVLRRHDVVVALTSPPLISVLAALYALLHRARFCYWVMDLNPDQAVAAGWLRRGSLAARLLQAALCFSLRRADRVIALDRFMEKRLLAKGLRPDRMVVLPPWSHEVAARFDAEGRLAFRAEHRLEDKFVVMYSGNHSPCHPLDTLLEAARRLRQYGHIHFCFVGGGSEHRAIRETVRQEGLANVTCLPYQPLDRLAASLSAADLHTVVMGSRFVGLVHPCKIYNLLFIGLPILYIGPGDSHIADIMAGLGPSAALLKAAHGEVETVVARIRELARTRPGPDPSGFAACAASFSAEEQLWRMLAALEPDRATPTGFPAAAGGIHVRQQPLVYR